MIYLLNPYERDLKTRSQITGYRIKQLLEMKDITQRDFFEKLGIKKTTYTKWLTGENNIPSEKLAKIAEELKCSTDFLLGLMPVSKPSTYGIMAILHKMGYDVQTHPSNEDLLMVSKNGVRVQFDVEDLENKIDHLLLYELWRLDNK